MLVIDDDPSIRTLYATVLEDEGYRVTTATQGQDGLDQLACRPDLILLDLMMPVMDGREFLIQLRRRAAHRDTPVLVMTASQVAATPTGAQAVMRKPFDVRALVDRVSGLLATA
ncbi:MAG: hypothetical protein QOH08_1142 [Chloroflexota bacterium]|nr:hypothetical protein [Chloroflexota bacterium]